VFVSALVQAEQVGAGFSAVLRIQSDDLRTAAARTRTCWPRP
jgi:hypothetical protein